MLVLDGLSAKVGRLLAQPRRGNRDDPKQREVEQDKPAQQDERELRRVVVDRGCNRLVGQIELEGAADRAGRVNAKRRIDLEQLAEAAVSRILGCM